MAGTGPFLDALLAPRLAADARAWLADARAEIAAGPSHARFAALVSLASRHAPRGALAPTDAETAEAARLLPGWTPERWTVLATARVALVLARTDLDGATGVEALEEAFRYADVGELCALYRSLAHLPAAERFAWRAGEGCRTNMRSVFESVACDTPYPARFLDDTAWRQLVIKCVFVGAPLWRVVGLDERVDDELARMALDLVDERRAAGREVQPELWLCLGLAAGERGLAALERELAGAHAQGRAAAGLALARAGEPDRLRRAYEVEADPDARAMMAAALDGRFDRTAAAPLNPAPAPF